MNRTQVNETNILEILKQLNGQYEYLDFERIDLRNYNFSSVILEECTFNECNLANVPFLGAALKDVRFENSNLIGIDWTQIRKGSRFYFSQSRLDYGVFQGVDLRSIVFENSALREVSFRSANLSKAIFSGSDLSGSDFTDANLEGADFRGARSYYFDPRNVKMKGAKFSLPDVLALIEVFGAVIE